MMKFASVVLATAAATTSAHKSKGHTHGHGTGYGYPIPIAHAPLVVKSPPVFPQEQTCTAPETNCPVGFFLQGDVCVKEIIRPADVICHTGVLQGELCISTHPTLPTCADGFVLRGNECHETITAPTIPFCPPGYNDIGTGCQKMTPGNIIEFCATGTRNGDHCVVKRTLPPTVLTSCPVGFEEEGGQCCKVETYDCTPAGAKPLDCADDDEYCGATIRYLKGSKVGKKYYGGHGHTYMNSTPVVAGPALGLRTAETAVISQTCQKKIVGPLHRDFTCTEGELRGGLCCTEDIYPTTPRCSVGPDVDNCFVTTAAAHLMKCPEGHQMIGGTCRATQRHPTIPTCPTGFNMVGTECSKATPAHPICREGIMKGDVCTDYDYAAPTTTWCVTCTGSACRQIGCGIGGIVGHTHGGKYHH